MEQHFRTRVFLIDCRIHYPLDERDSFQKRQFLKEDMYTNE